MCQFNASFKYGTVTSAYNDTLNNNQRLLMSNVETTDATILNP